MNVIRNLCACVRHSQESRQSIFGSVPFDFMRYTGYISTFFVTQPNSMKLGACLMFFFVCVGSKLLMGFYYFICRSAKEKEKTPRGIYVAAVCMKNATSIVHDIIVCVFGSLDETDKKEK